MFSEIFHIGAAVLGTAINTVTNTLTAQIGSVVDQYVFSDKAEWYQHVGLSSRPSKAVAGKSAAECLAIKGDRDVVFASRDVRSQQIYGNLKEGETCLWAGGEDGTGQGRIVLKQDGSINIFTTNTNTDAGNSVYFRVAKDGFFWVAPWGTLRWDATGFHLLTSAGARLDMGGIGGLPFPIDTLSSYASLRAGMVTTGGAINTLSSAPDAAPAAKATPVVEFMVQAAAAIAACAAATTGPGAAAALSLSGALTQATPGLAGQTPSGTVV